MKDILSDLNTFADYVFFLCALPGIAFPVMYLRSNWRSTAPGRSVMLLSISIAAIFVATLFQILWPDYLLRPVVRCFLYLLLTLALWRNLLTLLQAQQDKRDDNSPPRQRKEGRPIMNVPGQPDHAAPVYEVVGEDEIEPKTKAAAWGAGGGAVVSAFVNYLLDAWLWNGEGVPPDVPLPVSGFVGLVVTAGGAFVASYMARHVNRRQ